MPAIPPMVDVCTDVGVRLSKFERTDSYAMLYLVLAGVTAGGNTTTRLSCRSRSDKRCRNLAAWGLAIPSSRSHYPHTTFCISVQCDLAHRHEPRVA